MIVWLLRDDDIVALLSHNHSYCRFSINVVIAAVVVVVAIVVNTKNNNDDTNDYKDNDGFIVVFVTVMLIRNKVIRKVSFRRACLARFYQNKRGSSLKTFILSATQQFGFTSISLIQQPCIEMSCLVCLWEILVKIKSLFEINFCF